MTYYPISDVHSISDVQAKLQLTMAAPAMQVALETILPLLEEHHNELRVIAVITRKAHNIREADRWLTATMLAKCALNDAKEPVEKKERLVEMPRRVR
jgi:hypothetical protein